MTDERLVSIIRRVERIHEERDALADDVRDIFTEAKSAGYNVKAIRRVLQLRRMDAPDREVLETDVELYLREIEGSGTPVAIYSSGTQARAQEAAE